mmetsp:Transcript_40687/g.80370  ORF Transcript_40687/g.80370 Transcript_40687/m.80370 type:complete len:175 (-) Transcript_40687:133-657(-)
MGSQSACCCRQSLGQEGECERALSPHSAYYDPKLELALAWAEPITVGGQQIRGPKSEVTILPGDFRVSLQKRPGDRLGIDIDQHDGNWLLVHKVTGGAVSQWNLSHPLQAVKVGFKIMEVNGIRGNVRQMVAECKAKRVLNFVVRPTHGEKDPCIRGLCSCRQAIFTPKAIMGG